MTKAPFDQAKLDQLVLRILAGRDRWTSSAGVRFALRQNHHIVVNIGTATQSLTRLLRAGLACKADSIAGRRMWMLTDQGRRVVSRRRD